MFKLSGTLKFGSTILYAPLLIGIGLWIFVYILYESNLLIKYPSSNEFVLFMFISSTSFAAICGYVFGIKKTKTIIKSCKYRNFAVFGLLFYLILFIPIVYIYTGNSISNVIGLLKDPMLAYGNMQNSLMQSSRGDRAWLIVLKIIASPFVMMSIPYFSYRYIKFHKDLFLLVIMVVAFLLMSVFRGTDKEVFDVFILIFSVLVALRPEAFLHPLSRRRNILVLLILVLLMTAVFSVFTFKKDSRLGNVQTRCLAGGNVCYNLNRDNAFSFFLSISYAYLTQGYYGLSRSFETSYHSSWGFGSSRSMQYIGENLFDIDFSNNVVNQLDKVGWTSKGNWSTGFVWIANDVPFSLIPLVIFVLFFLLAWSYNEFRQTYDILSLVIFVYTFYTVLYMPLNLQISMSGDVYLGYLVLLFIFVFRKRVHYINKSKVV